jgi:HlyD family secretion protein
LKLIRPIILGTLVLGGLIWWLWSEHRQLHPGPMLVSGTIEADDIALGSEVGGRVVEVLAREGDAVEAHQVILRLDRDQLSAQRAETTAALQSAQAMLLELENGTRPEDIEEARARLAEREAILSRLLAGSRTEEIERARAELQARTADAQAARERLVRHEELRERGSISGQQYDDVKGIADTTAALVEAERQQLEELLHGPRAEEIEEARASVAAAQAALDRAEAGPRDEAIDRARADVAQVEGRLARIEADIAETEISSPVAGIVEVMDLEPGDLVAPQQTLATVILPDSLHVWVYVPEDRLGWASVGQQVEATVDSWPETTFHGEVAVINRRAEFYPRNVQTPQERIQQVFGVKIRLENAGDRLRAGMAADVLFPEPIREAN